MTKKQYEAAQTIMQLSRIYVNAMRECMKNADLFDDGYELHVNIYQKTEVDPVALLDSIRLDRLGVCDKEEYEATAFVNHNYEKEGWIVLYDPIIKSGTVPPIVRTDETARGVYQNRKTEAKPFAPDGLWLSVRDNCLDVDGGQ